LTTQSAALLFERDRGRVASQLERLYELARSALAEMQLLINELKPGPAQPAALLGGAQESDLPFKGCWHWQSLYYALWEAYLCVGLCIGVLYLFRRYADRQGRLATSLSRSAYAAYLIQAPLITGVALLFRDLHYHPLLKLALASLVAVPLCFGVGALLRRLPYARRVL
jgi:hypothetical protein